MGTLRDVLLTLVVLLALLLGLVALPFIIFCLIFLGVGYIVYATIHDRRLAQRRGRYER